MDVTTRTRCFASAVLAAVMFAGTAYADRWQPEPGTRWQIQYSGVLNTSLDAQIFFLDLFDTPANTIANLHRRGKKVVCYFSAGSFEKWRPDAKRFPRDVLGKRMRGWPGERWLDIRQQDVLLPIMKDRMTLARQKGCDAVDPDNVDGYANRSGRRLTYEDQLAYNQAIAELAHAEGLAVGLKNDLDQVLDLLPYFDFAVNEECFTYDECEMLLPFVKEGKPVFGIEYELDTNEFCPAANRMNFDFMKKDLELTAWRRSCRR